MDFLKALGGLGNLLVGPTPTPEVHHVLPATNPAVPQLPQAASPDTSRANASALALPSNSPTLELRGEPLNRFRALMQEMVSLVTNATKPQVQIVSQQQLAQMLETIGGAAEQNPVAVNPVLQAPTTVVMPAQNPAAAQQPSPAVMAV